MLKKEYNLLNFLLFLIIFINVINFVISQEDIDISKDLNLEKNAVIINDYGVEYKKLADGAVITFKGGSVIVNGNKFWGIKSQTEAKHPSELKLDSDGNVIGADFTVNKNGGTYVFGNTQIYAPPNSRVFFDNETGIRIKVEDDAEFTESPRQKDLNLPSEYLTIIECENECKNFRLPNGAIVNGILGFKNKRLFVSLDDRTEINGVELTSGVKELPKTYGGEVNLFFDGKEHNGDYASFDLENKKLILSSQNNKNFLANFKEGNPFILVSKENFLTIQPFSGSEIVIKNMDPFRQAPLILVIGDNSKQVWANIKNGDADLQLGQNGILEYKLSRRGSSFSGIPMELNIQYPNGKSALQDKDGNEIKISLPASGRITFSSINAKIDSEGNPFCEVDTCKTRFLFERQYSLRAAIESAREEYESNLRNLHDFSPEYSKNLENIEIFMPKDVSNEVFETQIEIMRQLPEYTQIKLFIDPKDQNRVSYLKKQLTEDIFSRIVFLEVPSNKDFSVWAQDYTEGDNEVQILPLTYLGGGERKMPDFPKNEFITQIQGEGVNVRRIPVEFGGGNIFIAKNKDGRKILLTGADSYTETLYTYGIAGEEISEEEFKNILKNSFNTDDVEMIGTRNSVGELERQPSEVFHIDQIMLPISDGVVAMPTIVDLSPPGFTEEELKRQRYDEYQLLSQKYGLKYESEWGDEPSLAIRDIENILTPDNLKQLEEEEFRIKEEYWAKEGEINRYKNVLGLQPKLSFYRKQMKSLGFEIVDLKTDPLHISSFQAYTNGIIYTDKNGQKTFIMPIFPDKNGEYRMEGLNLENKKTFERLGYAVKVVKDKGAFKRQGNIHCLTLLVRNSQFPPTCPLS